MALLGITSEFNRHDKVLSWSVFIYSMGWGFGAWLVILCWHTFKDGGWPNEWWANWFQIENLIVPAIIALVTTVWFSVGGVLGLRDMFRRLDAQEADLFDDGRVVGHVSTDDIDLVEKIEQSPVAETDEGDEGEGTPTKDDSEQPKS